MPQLSTPSSTASHGAGEIAQQLSGALLASNFARARRGGRDAGVPVLPWPRPLRGEVPQGTCLILLRTETVSHRVARRIRGLPRPEQRAAAPKTPTIAHRGASGFPPRAALDGASTAASEQQQLARLASKQASVEENSGWVWYMRDFVNPGRLRTVHCPRLWPTRGRQSSIDKPSEPLRGGATGCALELGSCDK